VSAIPLRRCSSIGTVWGTITESSGFAIDLFKGERKVAIEGLRSCEAAAARATASDFVDRLAALGQALRNVEDCIEIRERVYRYFLIHYI